ncbi:MAG: FHA domain-containing protein [Isosphaeraceae bacterium]
MKAELVPENGDPPVPIVRDVTVVGRRQDCDVVLQHPGVSKRHCILVKTDGLLVIRDLATTNGTKVKGQRVRWAALLPDDRISLGGYKLRVYLGADDMLSPSEQRGVRAGADLDTGLGDSGIDAGVTLSPGARGAPPARSTQRTFPAPSVSDVPLPTAAPSQTAAPDQGGEYFEIVEDEDEINELD